MWQLLLYTGQNLWEKVYWDKTGAFCTLGRYDCEKL